MELSLLELPSTEDNILHFYLFVESNVTIGLSKNLEGSESLSLFLYLEGSLYHPLVCLELESKQKTIVPV